MKTKKIIFIASILLVMMLVLVSCSATPTTTGTTTASQTTTTAAGPMVSIESFAFKPATLTVKAGTAVTWTNNDSAAHNIKSDSFNSPDMAKGKTFTFTFTSKGTFEYSCGIHPSMKGKIIVE